MELISSFGAFLSQFAVGIVSYVRTRIIRGFFITMTFAWSLGRYFNTRPSGFVFKQLPRDPANVNAWKTMSDPILCQRCVSDIEAMLNRHCFKVVCLLISRLDFETMLMLTLLAYIASG